MVELVLKVITDTLEKGETVKLSSFGKFIVRKKKERLGRNPKTGTEATAASRRGVQTLSNHEAADQWKAFWNQNIDRGTWLFSTAETDVRS